MESRLLIVSYSNGYALRIIPESRVFFHQLSSFSLGGKKKAENTAKIVADALRIMDHETIIEFMDGIEFEKLVNNLGLRTT